MGKRLFDICVSLCGLLLLAPVLVVIAMAVKFDSSGPIFYRQERVGLFGRHFRIFKFRSMTHTLHASGAQLTVAGDLRITRVGAVLRRYKLDELPQLIDVLRGTMSLVGPRPEVPRYVAYYSAEQREKIFSVRPGITDLASLHYRNENDLLALANDPEREYLEVVLPAKLALQAQYVDQAGVFTDLRLIVMTLKALFFSR
jgi:lipopolysaccharide/colanic/teichoic acid biosynthesis glycosyltransferase